MRYFRKVINMKTFVFDANIPIIFDNMGCFDVFENLFSSDDFDCKLIMDTANLNECKSLSERIKKLKRFNEIETKDEELLKKMEQFYEDKTREANFFKKLTPIDKGMHTKNGADYYLLMTTMIQKPDILVTNDRQALWFFNIYRNKYCNKDKSIQKIKSYKLANFLDLINRSFKKLCTNKELLTMNLGIYHKQELPNHYINMKRAKCFADGVDVEKYCSWNQKVFSDYEVNALNIY